MKFITYGGYIYAPLLAFIFWLATLLGLLLWWTVDENAKKYQGDEATIVFISDVGAAHKELFIPGTALTGSFYVLSLLFERQLRHKNRIPTDFTKHTARNLDIVAIIFGSIGALALLFLAIFDAFNYSTVHWSMTLVFVVSIAVSAIFQTAEVLYLKKQHPNRNHLRRNAAIKLVVVGFAVTFAICFGGTYAGCSGNAETNHCNVVTSVAAVFEWVIAFLYGLYLLTFVLDLWAAAKTSPRRLRKMGMANGNGDANHEEYELGEPSHTTH